MGCHALDPCAPAECPAPASRLASCVHPAAASAQGWAVEYVHRWVCKGSHSRLPCDFHPHWLTRVAACLPSSRRHWSRGRDVRPLRLVHAVAHPGAPRAFGPVARPAVSSRPVLVFRSWQSRRTRTSHWTRRRSRRATPCMRASRAAPTLAPPAPVAGPPGHRRGLCGECGRLCLRAGQAPCGRDARGEGFAAGHRCARG